MTAWIDVANSEEFIPGQFRLIEVDDIGIAVINLDGEYFALYEDYKQFPCKCRSKNCCGYIVRAESRWRINKKFSIARQQSNK